MSKQRGMSEHLVTGEVSENWREMSNLQYHGLSAEIWKAVERASAVDIVGKL